MLAFKSLVELIVTLNCYNLLHERWEIFTWIGASSESKREGTWLAQADCWWLWSTCVAPPLPRCFLPWNVGDRQLLSLRREKSDAFKWRHSSSGAVRRRRVTHLSSSPGTWHQGGRWLRTGRRSWAANPEDFPASCCSGDCRGAPCWGHWWGRSPLQTPSSAHDK